MLSGETAIGDDPVGASHDGPHRAAGRGVTSTTSSGGPASACRRSSGDAPCDGSRRPSPAPPGGRDGGGRRRHSRVHPIGRDRRAISRFRPRMPIVAVTRIERTVRQLSMSWGVETLLSEHPGNADDGIWRAVQQAVEAGFASPGDRDVVIAGSPYILAQRVPPQPGVIRTRSGAPPPPGTVTSGGISAWRSTGE